MQTALPTVTVRGFLNFRTTVDGTVIVFTPSSAAPTAITPSFHSTPAPQITTAPPASAFSDLNADQATPALPTATALPFPVESISAPTYSSTSAGGPQPYPTGLVTVLSSTAIQAGLTTELHTRVYGTYINGKYAQILKSSARLVQPTAVQSPTFVSNTPLSNYPPQARWPSLNEPQSAARPVQLTPAPSAPADEPRSIDNHKAEERNSVTIKQNRLSRLGLNSARFQQARAQHKVRLAHVWLHFIFFFERLIERRERNAFRPE